MCERVIFNHAHEHNVAGQKEGKGCVRARTNRQMNAGLFTSQIDEKKRSASCRRLGPFASVRIHTGLLGQGVEHFASSRTSFRNKPIDAVD